MLVIACALVAPSVYSAGSAAAAAGSTTGAEVETNNEDTKQEIKIEVAHDGTYTLITKTFRTHGGVTSFHVTNRRFSTLEEALKAMAGPPEKEVVAPIDKIAGCFEPCAGRCTIS